ncbi:MAG: hypothetical protein H6745_17450 [Deltaproteobacteria bacterium]|nr:hypothetical protein [Deltaproteobacteria bacterium]
MWLVVFSAWLAPVPAMRTAETEAKNASTIASPPSRGMGRVWILRSPGAS